MKIYCCACKTQVEARLTNGAEVYPHREDLSNLPFWKCDKCNNAVGCHHKSKNRTKPLGCIPTPELKLIRRHIHKILDPLWQSGMFSRSKVYRDLSKKIGWRYHTANIRSVEEGKEIYLIIKKLSDAVRLKQ